MAIVDDPGKHPSGGEIQQEKKDRNGYLEKNPDASHQNHRRDD
jgi:hypothetical protein